MGLLRKIISIILRRIINGMRNMPILVSLVRKVKARYPQFWIRAKRQFMRAYYRTHMDGRRSAEPTEQRIIYANGIVVTVAVIEKMLQEEIKRQQTKIG
jgi:hypothetical protein